MAARNRIFGLLAMNRQFVDGCEELLFDITGMRCLSDYLSVPPEITRQNWDHGYNFTKIKYSTTLPVCQFSRANSARKTEILPDRA